MDEQAVDVRVDQDTCVGTAMCVAAAPALFRLDAGRQAELVPGAVATVDDAVEAAEECPVGAIAVRGPDGARLDR